MARPRRRLLLLAGLALLVLLALSLGARAQVKEGGGVERESFFVPPIDCVRDCLWSRRSLSLPLSLFYAFSLVPFGLTHVASFLSIDPKTGLGRGLQAQGLSLFFVFCRCRRRRRRQKAFDRKS